MSRELLIKAMVFAAEAHDGQLDDSGESYFHAHLGHVADILKAAIFANTDMSFKSVFKATCAFYLAQLVLTLVFLAGVGVLVVGAAYLLG